MQHYLLVKIASQNEKIITNIFNGKSNIHHFYNLNSLFLSFDY